MVPNPSTTGNFIDSSFGLRYHSDSAHLRGIKMRASAEGDGRHQRHHHSRSVAERHQHESAQSDVCASINAGARGGLLDLIGSDSSVSGGNSMAPPTMVIPPRSRPRSRAPPTPGPGQHRAAQSRCCPILRDVTNVLESMKRISDAKYGAGARPTRIRPSMRPRWALQGFKRAATPRPRTSSTNTTVPPP